MAKLETGPVALYGQLAAILRDKVRSGIWADGFEIPTLEEMTEEYGLARVTVRQAVQTLVREGLLSSQRGRRTVVTYLRPVANPLPLFTSVDLVAPSSPDYSVTVLDIDEVTAESLAPVYRGRFTGAYVRLRKTDYEACVPYATSVHYIRTSVFERLPPGAVEVIKIARLVRDGCGSILWDCVERIGVKLASPDDAIELRCAPGSPLGTTHRVFLDGAGEILYEGRLSYVGDRFGIERDITAAVRG